MQPAQIAPSEARSIDIVKSIPFFAVHVAAVAGVVLLGWSWVGLAWAIGLYAIRMFGVTAGYHRYFSHRSYRTSRPMQLVLALLAMSSSQKGVLWWASHHRTHHKYSDQPGDVHSVQREGFLWGHVIWLLSPAYQETDHDRIRDLSRFPELVWLDRWWWLPPTALGVGSFLVGGWFGLVWAFLVSTVLLWHGTFTINSLAHIIGRRRYATTDNSRNSAVLSVITLGEGWHNNHHYYQRSVRQGFFWWEFDPTYYVLCVLGALGLVWDLHGPPANVVAATEAKALAASSR
jgi:stearoyl-CoA desaturase (delta-9 desaturase)